MGNCMSMKLIFRLHIMKVTGGKGCQKRTGETDVAVTGETAFRDLRIDID